jgi:hypothetical protein
MAVGFVLHSVLCEGPTVQVSYSDPAARTPHGTEIRTCVINLGPDLEAAVDELTDAALQLVSDWQGLMREVPRGGLPAS